jgi:hypothetical protein
MTPAAACAVAAVALVLLPGITGRASRFPPAAPVELPLSTSQVAEAVRIGSSDVDVRNRFHAAYRHALRGPLPGDLELITPFRRVVLMTEERVRQADTGWNAAKATLALGASRSHLSVVLDLRFNPQNAYRTVPALESVLLSPDEGGAPVLAIETLSAPRYVAGQPAPPGTPVLGARVESVFDVSRLQPRGRYLVSARLEGREIERVPVDFDRVR